MSSPALPQAQNHTRADLIVPVGIIAVVLMMVLPVLTMRMGNDRRGSANRTGLPMARDEVSTPGWGDRPRITRVSVSKESSSCPPSVSRE